MEQVQCSNCGGYKVSTWPIQIEQNAAERTPPQNLFLGLVGYVGIISVLIIMPIGIFTGIMGDGTIFLIGLVGFAFSIMVAFLVRLSIPNAIMVTKSYNHVCKICGYEWNWAVGTPRPEVRVNPHLIRQGGEHLKEQERQSRKAQGLE